MKKLMIAPLMVLLVNSALASEKRFVGNCAVEVARTALRDSFSSWVSAAPDINILKSVVFNAKYQVLKSQLKVSYEGVIGYDEYQVEMVEVVPAGGYPNGLTEKRILTYKVNPESCSAEVVLSNE